MAIKRVLAGATEIKELITYEDETKESVGKGQAGQVLKTDGTNTYWGEGGSVSLEAIKIAGSIDWESYDNTLEFTEENYQQFLKNKTAPVAINGITYTLSNADPNIEESGGYVEYYYTYQRITPDKIYELSIGWNPTNYGYSDTHYVYEIGSQVSYTPTLTEGTKIGTITIDGTNTDLYAPEGGGGSVDLSNYVDLNSEQHLSNKFLASNTQIGEAKVVSVGSLTIAGVLKDKNNTNGESGQILSSTGAGVEWKTIELGSSAYTKITDEVYFYDFVHIYIASNTLDGNYTIAGQTAAGMFIQTAVTISSGAVSLNFIVDGSVETSYDCALIAPNIYKNIEKIEVGVGIDVTPTESVYFVNYTSTSENTDSFVLDVSPFIAPLYERITALEGGSETPIWQPSTGTFMLNAEFFTKDWYVGFPIDCAKGEYSISVLSTDESDIIFSTIYEGGEDVNGAYFYLWPTANVSKMEYYTTTNELVVYKLNSFADIQEYHDKHGDLELAYVNTSGVSFVELGQPTPINSANINDYINPKLQPINAKLNELDDGVSVNRQEVTAITETLGGVKQDIIALEQGQSALENRVQTLESNSGGSRAITDFTGAPSFPENLIIDSEWEINNEAIRQELKSIDKFIYTDPNVGITAYFTLTSKIDISDGNGNWGYLLFTSTINHPIDGIHNCYFQCNEEVTYVKYYAVKVS